MIRAVSWPTWTNRGPCQGRLGTELEVGQSARRGRRRVGLAAAVLALALCPLTASAQPTTLTGDDEARAKELFAAAEELEEQGQQIPACRKYAESQRLAPRPATLHKVAACHVAEGKLATARAELHRVVRMARDAGQAEAAQEAQTLLDQIEPKISWLTVLLPAQLASTEGLYVTVNGRAVDRAQWGKPMAVDPGEYLVESAAPGRQPWSTKIPVKGAGDRQEVAVQLGSRQQAAPARPMAPAYQPRHTVLPPPPEERPDTLPYEDGKPIPDGYHKDDQIRTGLVVAGSITFGVTYLAAIAIGASMGDDSDGSPTPSSSDVEIGGDDADRAPMYVPVVGPFITLSTADPNSGGVALLVVDGLAQSAGLAMFIAGLAATETVLVRDEVGRARLQVTPSFGSRGAGLGLSGTL